MDIHRYVKVVAHYLLLAPRPLAALGDTNGVASCSVRVEHHLELDCLAGVSTPLIVSIVPGHPYYSL